MIESKLNTALWRPAWHAMDQGVCLNKVIDCWFYSEKGMLEYQAEYGEFKDFDFLFFNTFVEGNNCVIYKGLIKEIRHLKLGLVSEIKTDGLDYQFNLINGQELIVNAEEEPGKIYDSDKHIDDWDFHVSIADLEFVDSVPD